MARTLFQAHLVPDRPSKAFDGVATVQSHESGHKISYASYEAEGAMGCFPLELKPAVVVQETEVDPLIAQLDMTAIHIKSSPYDDPLNFLDLRDLDLATKLFALAFAQFDALRPDYATSAYMDTFNLSTIFDTLRDLCADAGIVWKRQEFYVVIFCSKLRQDANRHRLGQLDQMSHQEACASGGLLNYWFGSPNAENRNLATCIWRNREDAAAGGRGPWHKQARGAAREMYETISFHTHKLVVEDGALAWSLEDYRE